MHKMNGYNTYYKKNPYNATYLDRQSRQSHVEDSTFNFIADKKLLKIFKFRNAILKLRKKRSELSIIRGIKNDFDIDVKNVNEFINLIDEMYEALSCGKLKFNIN
tara:strand:+ start:7501 stop:7815 length:315 start_codon:yes stop_codon:yes gene_type:complete